MRAQGPVALALSGLAVLAGCGGERQDAGEPSGDFPVELVSAEFPDDQKLAKSSELVITVRNAGEETIPNIGMTVKGFNYRKTGEDLADPNRPVFAVDGDPVEIAGFPEAKDATPLGCDTALVNTWSCGPLEPGDQKRFVWRVTAVKAGPYELDWRVNAGLFGNAVAVAAEGSAPVRGSFNGTISSKAPESRVAEDGETVVSEPR